MSSRSSVKMSEAEIEEFLAANMKVQIGTSLSLADGINAVRATLPVCEFDAAACADGVTAA